MEIRASDKKIIAALVITAGAGIALTFAKRGNRKARVSHPAKINLKTAATRNSSRNSYPIHAVHPAVIPRVVAQPSRKQLLEPPCVASSDPDAPGRAEGCPPASHPAVEPSPRRPAVILSIPQRFGAVLLDVFIILFASCLFVGVPQIFGVSMPHDPFNDFILTCSVFLIAMLYVFLFMLDGRGTAAETWMKLRLTAGAFGGVATPLGARPERDLASCQ